MFTGACWTNTTPILEDGVYRRLLAYANEAPLPLENDECFRLVRAIKPDERKAVLKILSVYFVKTSEGYTQNRANEEIVEFKGKSEKASLSARKRWDANAHANASETHMRTHMQLEPSERNARGDASHSQIPDTRSQKELPSRSVVKEKKEKVSSHTTDRPTKNGYRPTLKDARELQDIMLRATGRAETDETSLVWLRATSSAGSFERIKQVLKDRLRKHKPNTNAWFKAVLQDQFGSSPAEAEDKRKELQERYRAAILIPDHKQRTVACSLCMEEAKDNGITLLGNPFA